MEGGIRERRALRATAVYGKRRQQTSSIAQGLFEGSGSCSERESLSPMQERLSSVQEKLSSIQGNADQEVGHATSDGRTANITPGRRTVNVTAEDEEDSRSCNEDVRELAGKIEMLSIRKPRPKSKSILAERDVNIGASHISSPVLRRSPRKHRPRATERYANTQSPLSLTERQRPGSIKTPNATEPSGSGQGETALRITRNKRALAGKENEPAIQSIPPSYDDITKTLEDHVRPLLDLCADSTSRASLTGFSSWAASLDEYLNITKIAEASYGEVYRLSLKDQHPDFTKADESVLKVIALKPPKCLVKPSQKKKIEVMSSVDSVASEAVLLRRMTAAPGFTNFRDLRVVRGRPPPPFIEAWRRYNADIKKSEFPDPSRKAAYSDNQLWAVLEMQDAGTDLESVMESMQKTYPSGQVEICAHAAWDLFWTITIALAKGEEWAQFEHRDLHIGNICIRLNAKEALEGKTVAEALRGYTRTGSKLGTKKLGATGLEATIIDYTLSRATKDSKSVITSDCTDAHLGSNDAKPDEQVAFLDLAQDQTIFRGDASREYQYEVYRIMRAAVVPDAVLKAQEPAEMSDVKRKKGVGKMKSDNGAETAAWKGYHPLTNVVWLHYLLGKLVPSSTHEHHAPRSGQPEKLKSSKLAKRLKKLCKLLAVSESLLAAAPSSSSSSTTPAPASIEEESSRASETNNQDSSFALTLAPNASPPSETSQSSQLLTEDAVLQHAQAPDGQKMIRSKLRLRSATALVEYAVQKGWLDEEDVVASGLEQSSSVEPNPAETVLADACIHTTTRLSSATPGCTILPECELSSQAEQVFEVPVPVPVSVPVRTKPHERSVQGQEQEQGQIEGPDRGKRQRQSRRAKI